MNYFLSIFIGYILGSIPTAYLLLKRSKGIDIRESGSGNVGALNSYEVSKSKVIGVLVLLIDFAKGALSVYITKLLIADIFIFPALAGIFAIFSHCFNPWLGLKGGRGLATAAGVSAVIFPYLLFAWISTWVIIFVIKRNIHLGNIGATILSLLLILSTPQIAAKYASPGAESFSTLLLFTATSLMIIFIKHIKPLKDLLKDKTLFERNKNG